MICTSNHRAPGSPAASFHSPTPNPMFLNRLFFRALLVALLGVCALPIPPAFAQNERRLEKIESARVAFLTNRLNLTPEQAQKFWPLYNEYDGRRREIRKRAAGRMRELATLSDAQLQGAVNDMLQARQDELNLDKDYLTKFQKAISLRQVVMLYRSERDFTKFLLRKMEERRGGGGGGRALPDEDDAD